MDDVDRSILAVLGKHGRISNAELAARVGLSPSPCLRRVRRLEETGVIRGYQALIDPAAPDIRFEYSLHAPVRGRDAVRAFAEKFRAAFPDLNFWGTADLIADGDYVVGQWEGGGTHTGAAFDDMPLGGLSSNTGKVMRFTGVTVLKVENGLITQEIGLDDGLTAVRQLGLIVSA